MPARIGLFGGSFNPIHFGHLITARSVAEQLGHARIMLIPASVPPHKQHAALAAPEHRLEMARRAVAGDPLFEVSDMELRRAGPSYTFDTVTALRARFGDAATFDWIIGADTLPELITWHRISELVRIVQFVTMVRPGQPPRDLETLRACVGDAAFDGLLAHRLTTPAVEISATDLRGRVARGDSIRYCCPDSVIDYIQAQKLYWT